MLKQPETRPISQEQLVAEVKGIYAGLVMVESKCIEVDKAQSATKDSNSRLNHDQWKALIALHRTLLHEHHDFFLASQHPSASPALRRLASKYAMPARMWRHGIHSFLELLRHRLPTNLEHMLTFIYLAYSMMALLYETVPAFEDTWIECLGDLGRYRAAIEDDDIKDREIWTAVSRHWYTKASDKAPTTGRLYHHLAILARPNALQQLFYYTKSLCVPMPFLSSRESIMTLFEPHLSRSPGTTLPEIDASFVRAHGILFSGRNDGFLHPSLDEFINNLDNHIDRCTRRWMDSNYHTKISLAAALIEYGFEGHAKSMPAAASRWKPGGAHQAVHHLNPHRLLTPSDATPNSRPPPHRTYILPRSEHSFQPLLGRIDPGCSRDEGPGVFFLHSKRCTSQTLEWMWRTFSQKWPTVPQLLAGVLENFEQIIRHEVSRPWRDCRALFDHFASRGLVRVDYSTPEICSTPSTACISGGKLHLQQTERPRRLDQFVMVTCKKPSKDFDKLEHPTVDRRLRPPERMECGHLPWLSLIRHRAWRAWCNALQEDIQGFLEIPRPRETRSLLAYKEDSPPVRFTEHHGRCCDT
ncbi:telomerase-binding protein EST1A protein [Colletotrichum plurivorum]|uniref:Telomerase-binding protein EST1A protein n=1 Tax=Colletotrichum plurivorum TaxID=2175906 RepID=A0A8H6K2M7_9PEZI|nr:telomerase-binding protein EST1A protein [Colletotrichum plurivorum]